MAIAVCSMLLLRMTVLVCCGAVCRVLGPDGSKSVTFLLQGLLQLSQLCFEQVLHRTLVVDGQKAGS